MKNKKLITLGFASVAVALALLFSTNLFASVTDKTQKKENNKEASRLEALAKFTKVISIVEQYNVDNVTIEELMDKALEGMMSNLDAHSNYLTQKDYKNLKVQTNGEFGGLGITVGVKDGALTVIAPIEGTPADKAGIKAGDIILKIDEKSTLSMTIDEAVSIMRGKVGTPIKLTVVREGETKPLEIKIVRGNITIESVYAKSIGNDIQYIRVTSFDKKVIADVAKAIKQRKATTKGIVLDLRNNPGGLLDQAVGLVNLFVDKGDIVSQKGRNKADDEVYTAKPENTITEAPLVVLVNGGSASASEIVSGSLQDHKRAIIVGQNTFGKGSVQVVLPITEEEAIKLTIARYYLPSGRTIQAVGVKPDIEVFPGEVKTNKNEYALKEADLKKHLAEELEKVDGAQEAEEEAKKDSKHIITDEMMNKDIQLKVGTDIIKALIITKGV
ncbi:MAG: peptidase S41 [Sulfurimonas sp. RIFCSPHIGHO2_12_FULL_36_9]|jgi:carboxyl-terminal processing protease|uniref:S41 family peptidase n=1 Tax=unclassified Sulfurimonas TaxID=2623549 RepID=UPI0008D019AC|nr:MULTISPECIES: S41 family peptidase [unclassified Sulfurimonas]OHD99206.1 MAG: peptidase S41 [Sulfurimonas sp. RIFCSPHIGHO2_12_FULL_36_9]OHE00011.1 MAG: peptidase S41 [Sulfurimonas sp. RIFCSPLOWO2_02_FULL_36_28]OHE01183.1 MAG: peptidase S41 [Sulfurimonas sp. RIFCSPLOWO2_12_36_12]OHE08364.1 MAG: peptidase S41 [Sulfurimonas sp. RIFCSPLOWO2_12_FULL_36_74]